jgi:hypothetical protein
VLGLSPADREAFFNGVKDSSNRRIGTLRGVAAAERLAQGESQRVGTSASGLGCVKTVEVVAGAQ